MKNKSAIILAGGKSRRFKEDKQLMAHDGLLVMDSIIKVLKASFTELIIVTDKPDLYADKGVNAVRDDYEDKGPLSGIYTGLRHAASDYCFVTACDMPFPNQNYINYMSGQLSNQEILVTLVNGFIEPFHGYYHRCLLLKLEESLINNRLGIQSFIRKQRYEAIDEGIARSYSKNLKMFLNINTQEERRFLKGEVL